VENPINKKTEVFLQVDPSRWANRWNWSETDVQWNECPRSSYFASQLNYRESELSE
jgi:hypothetical protein